MGARTTSPLAARLLAARRLSSAPVTTSKAEVWEPYLRLCESIHARSLYSADSRYISMSGQPGCGNVPIILDTERRDGKLRSA